MVALGRLVLSKRERVIALESYDNTLRYPVRKAEDYFCDLPNLAIAPDMLKLAEHILDSKAAEFDPATFRDRYDDGAFSGASLDRPALQKLLADVRAGTINIVLVYKAM